MNTFIKNNSLLVTSKGFSYNPNNLVLVYDTSKEVTNNTVSFPINGLTSNITVNWGDGLSDTYTTTGWKTHTYSSPGIYVVQASGTMRRLAFDSSASNLNNKYKLVRCLSFGNINLLSLERGFQNCPNLIECPNTLPTGVTNLANCFQGCLSFNSNISNWNITNVTRTDSMFQSATSFNKPLNSWNTANVILMSNMFNTASSFNQPLNSWNVSKVTSMSAMFNNTANFSSNLSSWNLSGLTSATGLANFKGTTTNQYGFTTPDYDAILIGWNSNKAIFRNDLSPNFAGSKYSSAASAARAALIAYGWTITDGGLAP